LAQPVDDWDGFESGESPRFRQRHNLLAIAWQRKSRVVFGILVGFLLGTLFYTQRPPVYQSGAQVLVVRKNPNVLPIAGGDPRLSYVEDYLATHLVLIRTPLLIERAVKKRDLGSLPSLIGTGDPVGAISAALSAQRDGKDATSGPNNIINLTYRGPVAADCGKVLKAIIESYKDFLDETYRNVSDDTLELITRARDILEKDLREKDAKLRAFRVKSPVVWHGKDGLAAHQSRVIEVESKWSTLLVRQMELSQRLKTIEKAQKNGQPPDAVLVLAMLSPASTDLRSSQVLDRNPDEQLLPLLLQEQQLSEEVGKDNPQLVGVRKRLAMARELLKRPGNGKSADSAKTTDPLQRQIEALKLELEETELMRGELGRLLEARRAEAKQLNSHELEEETLRDDVTRAQQLYESTIKRLAEINLVRDAGGFDARALSKPSAGAKVAPSAFQIIGVGVLLGALCGLGLAYLADVMDKSFRTPEEIRRRLGLAVVGHIPVITPDDEATCKIQAGATLLDPYLCSYYRPKSIEAEAYRAVRTALYFGALGQGHQVIQITSPMQGDGKSTLAANLGVSIAQSGKRVLLLDADCRRPRLHRLFGVPDRRGLATVIAGQDQWQDVLQETPIEGLTLLPCGPVPHNPAELLTSPRFQELLGLLRERYEFVLIDTPPLLAVTDPCAVAPRVDGVLLALRLAPNGRPQAERAREMLGVLGAKILGIVVNGVSHGKGAGLYSASHYTYEGDYEKGYIAAEGEESPREEMAFYQDKAERPDQ
jgi:capsular exopolysaccharide synthesis family protein